MHKKTWRYRKKRPPSPSWTCGFQSLWSTSWQWNSEPTSPRFTGYAALATNLRLWEDSPVATVSVAGYGACSATSQGSSRKNMYMDTMCSVAEWPNICPHWCCLRTTEVRSTVQSRQKLQSFTILICMVSGSNFFRRFIHIILDLSHPHPAYQIWK